MQFVEQPAGLDAWDVAFMAFHARLAPFFYRREVAEAFGDADGIFVMDETGFLKKGTKSVGVQRQSTGTAGKTENCQVGVFLTYVGPQGHAFLDRRLCLPHSWAEDRTRRAEAAVPEEVAFQTKPELTWGLWAGRS